MSIKTKTVWCYDEDHYFSDTHIAQPNPVRKGQWLNPPNCTHVKPELKPKCFYKIIDPTDTNSGWLEEPYPASAKDFIGVLIPHESRTMHHHILRTLLREFVKNESDKFIEKAINNEEGKLIAITVEAIPEPTEAELKAQKESAARTKRDYYLSLTDHLVSNDYPIAEEQKTEIKAYRQTLRDIPQKENFPDGIEWPEPPTFAKSAHKYWKSEQVSQEINAKVEAVEARDDLTKSQKELLITELRKVSQQNGYPYVVEWPVEANVLATATE